MCDCGEKSFPFVEGFVGEVQQGSDESTSGFGMEVGKWIVCGGRDGCIEGVYGLRVCCFDIEA